MTDKEPLTLATLHNNGDIELEEAVFEDPKAAARKWLQEYVEKKRKEEGCKEAYLEDYTDEELYDKLAKISVKLARLPKSRDQYTDHTRNCYKAEQARVRAELKRRGLRTRRPGSERTYPTAAHIAVQRSQA